MEMSTKAPDLKGSRVEEMSQEGNGWKSGEMEQKEHLRFQTGRFWFYWLEILSLLLNMSLTWEESSETSR